MQIKTFGKTIKCTLFVLLVLGFEQAFCKLVFGSKHSSLTLADASSYLILNSQPSPFTGTLDLPDEAGGRITGQLISFSDGVLKVGSSETSITGTYDPGGQNRILLTNGGSAYFDSSLTSKQIVVASGATASLYGNSVFGQPITLTDSTSILNLGLTSPLNQSINLNSGTLVLQNNLSVQSADQIIGSGTLNANLFSVFLPSGTPITGTLAFLNAPNVFLGGNTTISTPLSFQGIGGSNSLCGNGSWLFCNSGGKIQVTQGSTLYLSDIDFRNFGPSASMGSFDIYPTSTIVLQNSTISLAGNYTHSSGTIIFRGGSSKLLTNGFSWSTTTTSAFIVVDSVALEYEGLSGFNNSPFSWTAQSSQLSLSGGGTIRRALSNGPLSISGSQSWTTALDFWLSADSTINFINPTPASPLTFFVDMSGSNLRWPAATTPAMFALAQNLNLEVRNCNLWNFNKSLVSLGAAASLALGTGTNILLYRDTTVSGADFSWTFSAGQGSIIGNNTVLTLSNANSVVVKTGATLTLKNLTIVLGVANALACQDSTSTILLENCTIVLGSPGWTFSTGSLTVSGFVQVTGGNTSNPATRPQLLFSSTGALTVNSGSTLKIGRNLEFAYAANPANDGGLLFTSKRHVSLVDPTATLHLEGCTLHSTTTGLALYSGRLVFEDRVIFQIDGSGPTNAEIGSGLDVQVKAGSIVDVTGELYYK